MSLQKPLWMWKTILKRKSKRQGVVITEFWNGRSRRVAKWGPYPDQKRQRQAIREAEKMIRKLYQLWPCTFLVKGYDYKPPAHLADPPTHLPEATNDQN